MTNFPSFLKLLFLLLCRFFRVQSLASYAWLSPKNLAFFASVSRRSSGSGLVSRISTRSDGLRFLERGRNCSFVVKAEANAEVEVEIEEVNENAESVESEVIEASSAEESVGNEGIDSKVSEKPPRQPRIKLGDIMGIFMNLKAQILASQPVDQRLAACFGKLMADIIRSLDSKNRDKFTQNLTVFRHDFRVKWQHNSPLWTLLLCLDQEVLIDGDRTHAEDGHENK